MHWQMHRGHVLVARRPLPPSMISAIVIPIATQLYPLTAAGQLVAKNSTMAMT